MIWRNRGAHLLYINHSAFLAFAAPALRKDGTNNSGWEGWTPWPVNTAKTFE